MKMFAFTTPDGSSEGSGTAEGASASQLAGQADAINNNGVDLQSADIAPYQSAAAFIGPYPVSAFDPVGTGSWLTQETQPAQGPVDGWLTPTMQTGGAPDATWGAGSPSAVSVASFESHADQLAADPSVTPLPSPNPLTHTP